MGETISYLASLLAPGGHAGIYCAQIDEDFPMHIVGIIGGIASGKTSVAREFEKLGASVIDADAIGREVLTHPEVIDALTERWGSNILSANGNIDRSAVARIVFAPDDSGPIELKFLEALTHPLIGNRIESEIQRLRDEVKPPFVVLDAAVLLKTKWDQHCDEILFVEVPLEIRLQRAIDRGWSAEQFTAREEAQTPVAEKRRRADQVIDNSGDLTTLAEQIRICRNRWVG